MAGVGAGDGELRIGDRERREVDDRLRAAHEDGMLTLVEYDERAKAAYAARFRSDLQPLVADLPTAAPDPAPDQRPTTASEPARGQDEGRGDDWRGPGARLGHRGRRRGLLGILVVAVVAIMAPGVLSADQGAAVLGGRTVTVTPGESNVEVGVLFGSMKVVVPDGTRATTTGTTILGGTRCEAACAPAPAGSPEVRVDGRGAFGSIRVVTATEDASQQD